MDRKAIFLPLKNQIEKAHAGAAIAVALLLLLAVDPIARRIETIPDLVLRNEYQDQEALPYLLARMRRAHPSIALLGDSVLQGVTNTVPEDAAPVVIEKLLNAGGREAHCFNTATMGYKLGDEYAVGVAAMKNGADALVLSIHYKLFSSHPIVGSPMRYKDNIFYLRGEPDFTNLLHLLQVSPSQWWSTRLRKNLENVWAFYRYRGMITHLMTGSTDNPLQQLQDEYAHALGVTLEGDEIGRNVLRHFDPAIRDREYIWKEMIKFHHEKDRAIYHEIEMNRYNPHVRMLARLVTAAKRESVPLLLYFTPLNRELNEQYKYFSYTNLEHFKGAVARIAEQGGAHLADMTDAVPSAHFSDADHITKKGHRILAEQLAPHVAALLDGETTP